MCHESQKNSSARILMPCSKMCMRVLIYVGSTQTDPKKGTERFKRDGSRRFSTQVLKMDIHSENFTRGNPLQKKDKFIWFYVQPIVF